ncbi:MAG TPA: hypothetical protein DIW30_03465 [Bacteroidales bacterium]|nr:hypothetical protein [Bacteroidales bacterium]
MCRVTCLFGNARHKWNNELRSFTASLLRGPYGVCRAKRDARDGDEEALLVPFLLVWQKKDIYSFGGGYPENLSACFALFLI